MHTILMTTLTVIADRLSFDDCLWKRDTFFYFIHLKKRNETENLYHMASNYLKNQ